MVPQSKPAAAHVVVMHVVHVCETASQTSPVPQPPQAIGLPHPSMMLPHLPVQSPATHAAHWCVCPSQTWPGGQLPQTVRFPHLSGMTPHAAPVAAHTFVTHVPDVALQVDFTFGSHVPHSCVPEHVARGPHVKPWA